MTVTTPIYEMGQSAPVGYIMGYYSSGSCYSAYHVDHEIQETRTTYESKWVCHYCGVTIKGDGDKCPNCAGEKRAQVFTYNTSRSRIRYCEDGPPAETVFEVVKSKDAGWLDKLAKKLFGG